MSERVSTAYKLPAEMIRRRVLCVVALVVLSVLVCWSIRSNVARMPVRGPGKLTVDRTKQSGGWRLALVEGNDADLWEFHEQFMLAQWPTYHIDSFLMRLRVRFSRVPYACDNRSRQIVQSRSNAWRSIKEAHSLYFVDYGPGIAGVEKAIAVLRGAGWDVKVIERVCDESARGN